MDGWINGWMDGSMDGCMIRCIVRWMYDGCDAVSCLMTHVVVSRNPLKTMGFNYFEGVIIWVLNISCVALMLSRYRTEDRSSAVEAFREYRRAESSSR